MKSFFSIVVPLCVILISCQTNETDIVKFQQNGVEIEFMPFPEVGYKILDGNHSEPEVYYKIFSPEKGYHKIGFSQVMEGMAYSQLKSGSRVMCFSDYFSGNSENARILPSHTEILNDTTFLLGNLWFSEAEEPISKEGYLLETLYGWTAIVVQPSKTTYATIWHDNHPISLDSLLNWSLELRQKINVQINGN